MTKKIIISFLTIFMIQEGVDMAGARQVKSGFEEKTGKIYNARWRSGVPLGGLGCGKFEILTDGSFANFTINHNWDRPTGILKGTFAAIHTKTGKKKVTKILRLRDRQEYTNVENVQGTEYLGMFPTLQLRYLDTDLPVNVELFAYSPLIPQNIKDSGLPAAILSYTIENPTSQKVEVALLLSWQNILGFGGKNNVQWENYEGNTQTATSTKTLTGVMYTTSQKYDDQRQNTVGEYFVAVEKNPKFSVNYCESWDAGENEIGFWSEFAKLGFIANPSKTEKVSLPVSASIVQLKLAPKEKQVIEFVISWYMPNHITQYTKPNSTEVVTQENVGHYYTNFFDNAKTVAEYVFNKRQELLTQTQEWQNLVTKSNLPFWLKLKLINCAFPLFSNTILAKDGRFAVQESPVDMAGALGTMDQRMAAHPLYTMFYPELDRRELELYAKCQDLVTPVADGRIPHFDGNIHEIIGDPNVGYGVTDWPDLTCSWVMQTLKLYRWTGDKQFLDRQWPHIQRAMQWLKDADHDGDTIPEGGSTYDYEPALPGGFCYSASCYLGALKSAIEIARVENDTTKTKEYQQQFEIVQRNVIKHLWNGKYFIKWSDPKTGQKNENCFIAQLAGDWLSQLSGLGATLPDDIRETTVKEILGRNVKPFYPSPPMEVTPDGEIVVRPCFIIQHEPYIGMESVYNGYVDDGLDVIKRVYDCVWSLNKNPWNQSLSYDSPDGLQGILVCYMTCPATWHILNALMGMTINLPEETLYISPRLPSDKKEWHLPLFFSKFWVWVDYVPNRNKLVLKIIKTFSDKEIVISNLVGDQNKPAINLKEKFVVKENTVLDLSEYIPQLVVRPFIGRKTAKLLVPAKLPVRQGLSSKKWTAECSGDAPEFVKSAFDGYPETRWTTRRPMQPGDYFMVDLGKRIEMNRVVIDCSSMKDHYPRGYRLEVSINKKEWKTVAGSNADEIESQQKEGVIEIQFDSEKVRYLKITQPGSASVPWSIHELLVFSE